VFYADRFTPQKGKAQRCEQGTGAGDAVRSILKRFSVFNVAQCESLPERFETVLTPLPDREPQPQAEALIAATGADFRIGGAQAFYVPALDYVQVPPQPAFAQQIDYYRTVCHELGHWTGHASRLGRDQSVGFGTLAYAREEL
jgi:antirestriction protein ArdC